MCDGPLCTRVWGWGEYKSRSEGEWCCSIVEWWLYPRVVVVVLVVQVGERCGWR